MYVYGKYITFVDSRQPNGGGSTYAISDKITSFIFTHRHNCTCTLWIICSRYRYTYMYV